MATSVSVRAGKPNPFAVHGLRWGAVLAVFVVLELLSDGGSIDPLILPAPSEIASAMWDMVQTSAFWGDVGRTTWEIAAAAAIGVGIGVPLGVVLWRFETAGEVVEPYLATLYSVPTMVFYPILLALLGLGALPIIVLAAFIVFVPVTLNTIVGLRAINPVIVKLGRSLACSRRQQVRHVLLPASAPLVLPGIQLGVVFGLVVVIGLEFLQADKGLGYRIRHEYDYLASANMWAAIMAVMVIGMLIVALGKTVAGRTRRDIV